MFVFGSLPVSAGLQLVHGELACEVVFVCMHVYVYKVLTQLSIKAFELGGQSAIAKDWAVCLRCRSRLAVCIFWLGLSCCRQMDTAVDIRTLECQPWLAFAVPFPSECA